MTAMLDAAAADPCQIIADLQQKLDARTAELSEAQERETATADILQVINSSPGDLAPVFDAVLEKAMHLCEASFGMFWRRDGDRFYPAALRGVPPAFAEYLTGEPLLPAPGSGLGRAAGGEPFVHIADIADSDAYRSGDPQRRALVDLGGGRTALWVALRKESAMLGGLTIYRQEVRPFSDKQIALLQNFAAQAVIAMENARLLGELRQRTGDLQESLEYQTATSDVLKFISRSTFDLQPVFETIIGTAARLCDADTAFVSNREREACRVAASFAASPEFDAFIGGRLLPVNRGNVAGRTVLEGRVVEVDDIAADPEFNLPESVTIGKLRTALGVPLLREGVVVGTINLGRTRVEPFTERQIDLVSTFADQAVIALENARLITETQEALEQQTATAEVLQVINSSPGDLGPVFEAMLEKALHLCEASHGHVWGKDGDWLTPLAVRGDAGVGEWFRRIGRLRPRPDTPVGRVVYGEGLVHIADVSKESVYHADERFRQQVDAGNLRTLLVVPLRQDDVLLGALTVYRQEVRPFSDKQIALLQNFAAQAVIAMENARLLTETREALEQQTATAEVLGVINSSPGDLGPVFEALLEKATRLCEAPFGIL